MGYGGGSQSEKTENLKKPTSYHVMEVFRCPTEVLSLPVEDRKKIAKSFIKSAGPEGFPADSNKSKAAMSAFEELAVMVIILVCMGAPWTLIIGGVIVLFTCSWPYIVGYALLVLALIYHPLPKQVDNVMEEGIDKCPAWIGCGGPHGVMPFGNVLSIPAINQFTGTPGVKYMSMFGCIDVSAKSMTQAVESGLCVGMVPDGIAGIFRSSKSAEVFYVRNRKGLAKLALRTGIPIIPVYSVGNSEALCAGYDGFGIAEYLSRKLQAGLFVFWGRLGLPIPFRTNVSLLLGRPIRVDKMAEENITQADVDRVHQQMLDEVQEIFDTHKGHLGWGHKTLVFD